MNSSKPDTLHQKGSTRFSVSPFFFSYARPMVFAALLLAVFTISCQSEPAAPTTASPPLPTAQPSLSDPNVELLVFLTPSGIEALNPHTNQVFNLETRHVLAPQDFNAIPSPSGNAIAYITGQEGFDRLSLRVLMLPNGDLIDTPLYPDTYSPGPDIQPGDPGLDAIRAILESNSFDWSPDGRYIVFTALTEDLRAASFLLDTTRPDLPPLKLASQADHLIRPRWSPDSRFILYTTITGFGQGDGNQLSGFWSVEPDGSDLRLLYVPEDSLDENLIGWITPDTFLVHSRHTSCGFDRLRAVNILNGDQSPVWDLPFNGLAYDALTRRVLLSVDQFTAQCGGGSSGLFLFSVSPQTGTNDSNRLTEEEAFLPVFDPLAGIFLARTPVSVLAVGPRGEVWNLQAPEPFLPVASSNGRLAWASSISGVWVGGFESPPLQLTSDPAGLPAWTPDGSTLYFLDAAGLWSARAPAFQPLLVVDGFTANGAFWLHTP